MHFFPQNSDPLVNAMVDDRFADALEEAKSIDRALDNGEQVQGPLLGVPFTGKDSHSVKGLAWTAGLVAKKVRNQLNINQSLRETSLYFFPLICLSG